jgi:hypothetical protein
MNDWIPIFFNPNIKFAPVQDQIAHDELDDEAEQWDVDKELPDELGQPAPDDHVRTVRLQQPVAPHRRPTVRREEDLLYL